MQPIDVSPTNLDTVRQILQQHVPKVEVRAFGSRVGWMARETSDLDLALMTDEPLPIGQVVALKAAFTKSNLPFRVDIVDWASTSENFRHVIKRDYVVLVVAGEAFEGGRLGLASEWRETALGSITKFLSGGTPSKRNPAYWNGSVPWVSAKDMKRFRLCDTEDHVTTEGVVNGTKLIPPGTVLLLTRGMRLLKELPVCVTERPMTFNQDIKALCPAPDINRDFFPYLVLGNRHRLQSLVDLAGHGTGRLNSDELKAFEVSLPPLREQRAIAHILGTLDDKIELNRRMNETLEAMARALFKSWFVDFDPVCAKMEGRDTGLPKHLADLFPDRLVDSELGEIPEGWEAKPLAETVDVIGGGTPKTSVSHYWDGDIPWFSVVDAPTQSDIWVVDTAKKVTQRAIENSAARILPVGTTIISARGTVGRIALVGVPMAMNQSCYGLRPSGSKHGLFNYFTIHALVVPLQQRTHGSVFDTITRDTLAAVYVVSPCPDIIDAYEELVRPALERIRAGLFQSRNLVTLRDTLLPKLIAGELRVEGVNVNC